LAIAGTPVGFVASSLFEHAGASASSAAANRRELRSVIASLGGIDMGGT
jgi:hypothetical protein